MRARPLSEWHEDYGDVLWWKFPIEEVPYCGTPNDLGQTIEVTVRAVDLDKLIRAQIGGWPGYHTHWTPLPEVPEEPMESVVRRSRTDDWPERQTPNISAVEQSQNGKK